ncbi:NADH dehydrogenase subunit 4 (mitochondrion) [Culicoides brevitarsis]|uniref:NADH dehydrogenase subunit 4 n=1 Tax=Culicoides brevitarsis TaxID=469753 RepID=UPI002E7A8C09|nr:NADH dehydrogenase subunit 4 [Culicoides brevitarsis]WPN85965.2 NADH dehydrogenase subunit 4 [Culicoides brevitarsis]
MLMFFFFSMSILIMSFNKKIFWMVQNFIFLLFFLFMIMMMNCNFFPTKISYFLGLDILSYGLILLSLWITSLMFMSSEKIYKYNNKLNYFIFMVIFLMLTLILTFSSLNLFLFYFFFESSLIPTFFLILGWGYQPERLQAGFYLMFYTLFASLPLLMTLLYCQNNLNSLSYFMLFKDYKFSLLYFSLIMAFLVKMPMFFVHLWLLKAHVEAPVSGSMILAGVLLKLGGYGLFRIYILIQSLSMKYNIMFYVISLIGGMLISLMCLMQVDMKALIAYSSVAHMGIAISGLMTLSIWGFMGSYILMIGHGLCSSGLFCLSNIIYERTSSRSLFINKGLMNFIPSISMWWFLLSISNMAAPPSLNLMGEIFLLTSIINWSWLSMFFISLMTFLGGAYSIYLYCSNQHGNLNSLMLNYNISTVRENLVLMLHWLPLNLLILKPDFCMFWI